MPPLPTQAAPTPGRPGAPARSLWRAAREHLEAVKEQVLDELRQYPAPVTACDAQFNYLLERRDAASEELARLDAIPGGAAEHSRAVADLVRSSKVIDADTRRRLLAQCAP